MNPPPQLPFPIESGWDYILTEADQETFAPKKPTDEYFCGSATTPYWETADRSPNFHAAYHYRRRKPASGWVRVTKESLPETCKSIWVKFPLGVLCIENGTSDPSLLLHGDITHWRYCEGSYQIPPPPEPEREAWEVAFEAADNEAQSKLVGPTADCWAFTAGERKASFKAGWAAKAKEGK